MTMPTDVLQLLWTIILTLCAVIVAMATAVHKEWIVSGKTYRQLLRITEKTLNVADKDAATLEQLSRHLNDDDERR